MKVSVPPRFGVSAAAGAAMVATQRAAPRLAAANPDFLIISFLLLLLGSPFVVGRDLERHPLDHFPARRAAVSGGTATPRRELTHLALTFATARSVCAFPRIRPCRSRPWRTALSKSPGHVK